MGSSTRTCLSTGRWSGSAPTCRRMFVVCVCVGGGGREASVHSSVQIKNVQKNLSYPGSMGPEGAHNLENACN